VSSQSNRNTPNHSTPNSSTPNQNKPKSNTPNSNALPIGLFDSGVGGLSVLKQLQKSLPNENFIYLGDTARTPYGTRGLPTIRQYSKECENFLNTKGVKLIVVACNTASSAALSELEVLSTCPVIGVISPASNEALRTTKGRIGILGTKATIRSEAYQLTLTKDNHDLQILAQACPLFVPMVEEGIFDGQLIDLSIERYLSPMKNFNPDTLILGCTHYPLLRKALERYFGPSTTIIDCGEATANVVVKSLQDENLEIRSDGVSSVLGKVRYFVTDEANRFKKIAKLFLGLEDIEISVVEV